MLRDFLRDKNKRLFLLLLILMLTIVGWAYNRHEESGEKIFLPSLSVSLYGKTQEESFHAKEKVLLKPYVLFEFFSLECPHCIKSIPALNKLNKHKKLSVVGYIAADTKKVRRFLEQHAIEYTVSRPTEEYFKIFQPFAYPMSFLIDTNTLEIKARFIGEVKEEEIVSYL